MSIGPIGLGSSSAGWGRNLNTKIWPDPFMDYASLAMPETIQQALRWAEFIFLSHGTYREACRRVVTYFITDLELESENGDNQLRWRKLLEDQLDYRSFLNITGLDLACYGVSFTSVVPIYVRHLSCKKCHAIERPFLKIVDDPQFNFRWSDYAFCASCPLCGYSGPWQVIDRQAAEHSGFKLRRWSPHDIDIVNEPWTGLKQFKWKIPESYRAQIRRGIPHVLAHAPLPVIKAVRNGNDLLFDKDFVHYMQEDALAGVNDEGWGISRVLTNFRQAWYVQVLHRYNEAIALDYVIPFRLLTPAPGDKSSAADPLVAVSGGSYMQQVAAMFRRRAIDPAAINTLPFPVQYQSLGGDAKALAPGELLTQGVETLLNNIGIPAELYRASLTAQAMPAALRLFEASHASLPHNLNGLLRFVVRQIATMLRWPLVDVKLSRVTHSDDPSRDNMRMELMQAGLVSKTSGLRVIGLDYKQEVRQDMADQQFAEEQRQKLSKVLDMAAQGQQMAAQGQQGQPMQGGQPQQDASGQPAAMSPGQSILAGLPQGPNVKITPQEQLARASNLAQRLLGEPESQKDSDLMQLRNVDPNLHAIVIEQMESIRRKARMQGGQQVLQQTFGKAGSVSELAKVASARLRKVVQRAGSV